MIQAKTLEHFSKPIRNTEGITLQQLLSKLKAAASENEIPLAFDYVSVKFGSMFTSHVDECLCLSHPEHIKDYYSVLVHHEDGQFETYRFGTSKQMAKQNEKQKIKSSGGTLVKGFLSGHGPNDGVAGNLFGAGTMMKGTAGMLFHAIKAAGGSKAKLQEEEAWYSAICSMIVDANSPDNQGDTHELP